MSADSMNFVGSELELRTNHEAYNENTRIPQAKHKFEGIVSSIFTMNFNYQLYIFIFA